MFIYFYFFIIINVYKYTSNAFYNILMKTNPFMIILYVYSLM